MVGCVWGYELVCDGFKYLSESYLSGYLAKLDPIMHCSGWGGKILDCSRSNYRSGRHVFECFPMQSTHTPTKCSTLEERFIAGLLQAGVLHGKRSKIWFPTSNLKWNSPEFYPCITTLLCLACKLGPIHGVKSKRTKLWHHFRSALRSNVIQQVLT